MIFAPHIIVGALIGTRTKKPLLIIILGLLSHFILDKIPHWDYSIYNIKHFSVIQNYNLLFGDVSKILIDIFIGLLIVVLVLRKKNMLNKNHIPYVVLGIFTSLLPDILWGLGVFIKTSILDKYTSFHNNLHYVTQKEGGLTFLGLSTQIAVIISALVIFFL